MLFSLRTEQLTKESYFGSYNIPYFKKMFDLTGGTERVRSFGAWFGYDTNPRALIIREQQSTISSLRDMYRVARYNDYKHDVLSRCPECRPPYSACNAIAARNDLNPADGWYPFRALGHRSHGATDAKITSYKLHKQLKFIAVSSPPHNTSRGLPPFRWSKFDLKVPHMGHPDLWTFPPVVHSWNHGGDGTTNDDD
ncbi:unnamed protein product [Plutella xylostella]|uniref:Phospholipase B-like n=1 Tax=Plutella xylostella TaxID=51655 RepID=A0A8S4FL29_PLUXY|nr:unnamed protein product [Plutella xylostella]